MGLIIYNNMFKFAMFITSLLPLWVTIIFLDLWDIIQSLVDNINLLLYLTQIISVAVIFVVCLISIFYLLYFLHYKENTRYRTFTIIAAHKENRLTVQFLISYIVPLIAFDFSNIKDLIVFVLFIFVLGYLCIKNNNVYINIFLELLHYKIYIVTFKYKLIDDVIEENVFALSKIKLDENLNEQLHYCWDIAKEYYIIADEKGDKK